MIAYLNVEIKLKFFLLNFALANRFIILANSMIGKHLKVDATQLNHEP